MEPEKFEKKVKNLLEEREIKPSSQGWEQLEQRLEHKKTTKPRIIWAGAAAAVAVIFFILGTFYNSPIASEEPRVVEQTPDTPVLEEKIEESEVIQLATSTAEAEAVKSETAKITSAERPSKNAIFEPPVRKSSEEEIILASEISSEVPETITQEKELLLAEQMAEKSQPEIPVAVSDTEIEELLFLATAELKSDPAFTIDHNDLLHQVEYELDQSFRQKVFEVVKEGFLKAKTAVANRDF